MNEGDDVGRSNSYHGANAEAVREPSPNSDPEAFSARVNTLRRGLLPPHLHKELITRGGKRRNIPRIPHRYSKRLRKGVVPDSSPSEDLSTGFSCLTEKDLQPFNGKSMNELMTNVLIEGTLFNKNELIDIENDDDNIDDFVAETPYDQLFNEVESGDNGRISSEDKNLKNIQDILHRIEDEEMKNLIEKWIYKYSSVFSDELTENAANVQPFVLTEKAQSTWASTLANKAPPRWQMLAKQKEVKRFIDKALKAKLIQPSKATAWSQVLLCPKPDGKWRFCIDFRNLNSNTNSEGWPLPNIKHIFERISRSKAKYFAVIDLTQGYYQMKIDERSRHLTAFRTALGIFEWLRLPMGLKGAGSYYQSMMQNVILTDLLYAICESYLDDILVYGRTKKELSDNLKSVISRLSTYGITVNPAKVKIHMDHVEYVGYVLDKYGITLSDEKRAKVTSIRLPTQAREMKSFLGLISQFRDHVPRFSELTAPFTEMIPDYKKGSNKPLQWTSELTKKFTELQDAVANCCKLYFLDERLPIYLHTDASIYGIGVYLFQVKDKQNIPIQFLNKQLNSTERKWNIVEKEMYAIFYSFMKLEHLLRDNPFTLRTDSKILSRMNTDHKEKVKRWKIAIQHFPFTVEHISGKFNVEADALSRLVPLPQRDNECHILEQTLTVEKDLKIDPIIYNKIKRAHGDINGHGGVQRTIDILTKKLNMFWKWMRNDVSTFIERCPCCQKMRRLKPLIHTIPFTLASYQPMKRICIDAIGPINIDGQKYKHILVFIDAFSRYVKLFPLETITSEEVLHSFNEWVCTFGCPSEIVTDNASYFLSELMKSFNDFTGMLHNTIQPYSHEENGIVERANQEVIRHLTAIVADKDIRSNWPKYLPYVQRIMNTFIKSSIGVSPNELIFGTSINHDDHFLTIPELKDKQTYHEHMINLTLIQERILKIAVENQEEHDLYVIAERSKGSTQTTYFPINSYVLVEYETQKTSKLHSVKHGPYRVLNFIGNVYTVEHLVRKDIRDFHVKLLSEYKHDDNNVDVDRVAKLDDEYADITSVLNHKFNPTNSLKRTNLEFLLTWDDDDDPKWYRWNSSLGDNEKIHEYLDNNKLRKFIPIKYTYPKDHPEEIARRAKRKREH